MGQEGTLMAFESNTGRVYFTPRASLLTCEVVQSQKNEFCVPETLGVTLSPAEWGLVVQADVLLPGETSLAWHSAGPISFCLAQN